MRFGFVMPSADVKGAVVAARAAEDAGWDGFFVWESLSGIDAWVTLGAAAVKTERIRLGTMLTPPARMRPWKLASQAASVDVLSDGRVILSVGLGATDFLPPYGEQMDRRVRAELLDESLSIITSLWSGEPFRHEGKHYQVDGTALTGAPFAPLLPVQRPRVPIWVVGAVGKPRSTARAFRYDGVIPTTMGESGARAPTLDEVRRIADEARASHPERRFDVVVEGATPHDDAAAAAAIVAPWRDAGATWWIEAQWDAPDTDAVLRRIDAGPPQLP